MISSIRLRLCNGQLRNKRVALYHKYHRDPKTTLVVVLELDEPSYRGYVSQRAPFYRYGEAETSYGRKHTHFTVASSLPTNQKDQVIESTRAFCQTHGPIKLPLAEIFLMTKHSGQVGLRFKPPEAINTLRQALHSIYPLGRTPTKMNKAYLSRVQVDDTIGLQRAFEDLQKLHPNGLDLGTVHAIKIKEVLLPSSHVIRTVHAIKIKEGLLPSSNVIRAHLYRLKGGSAVEPPKP